MPNLTLGAAGGATFGNSTISSTNFGVFGQASPQYHLETPTLNGVIQLLRAYGLATGAWTQQAGPLYGDDGTGNPGIGFSIALSDDGNTLAVGGYFDSVGIGATWIFTRTVNVWTQQGSKLVGTGAIGQSKQGSSVSLSSDGNTLAVGGPGDNSDFGATWIFTRTAGVWTQQGKLVGTTTFNAKQGTSVSLSSNGNTLAIGGTEDQNGGDLTGATWIFTRTLSAWSEITKLVGTGVTGGGARQGQSVSLSSDGNTLAVGGPFDNTQVGATWIFVYTGSWAQQGSKIVASDYTGQAKQGQAVSLSSDGDTLAVGGNLDNSGVGATWVYIRSLGVWTQQGSKIIGTGATGSAGQGDSVSLSDDGNVLVFGGYGDDTNIGAFWIYTRNAGVWIQASSKNVPTGYNGTPRIGISVYISKDSSTIGIGGYTDDTFFASYGAFWVYA